MSTPENVLIHGAFADLLHDFGEIVPKNKANKDRQFMKDIYLGLQRTDETDVILDNPDSNLNVLLDSEEEFLLKILPAIGDNFVPSSGSARDPLLPPTFQIGKDKGKSDYYANLQRLVDFTFLTVIPSGVTQTFNGEEYVIKQRVLINKKNGLIDRIIGDKYDYHEPSAILEYLGIKNNSAFVVDFAAISLPDFLTAPGAPGSELVNLYFITNPETENDAAGKTSPTSACYFMEANNGIKIHSLQQTNSATGDSSYRWLNDKTAYGQFFTKYNFTLSDLIEVYDGKRLKLKTRLTITNDLDLNLKEDIDDSGNASNITFVKESIFKRIKNLFSKKQKLPAENFFVNSKFQHKRSGDWLQVLSCVNLKERAYKEFVVDKNTPPIAFDPSIITDVYFVTHDRIALGFALYLGLNAIYTHAATSTYYVFQNTKNLGTPEERSERERANNEKIQANNAKIEAEGIEIYNKAEELNSVTVPSINEIIDAYNAQVNRIAEDIKQNIMGQIQTINAIPDPQEGEENFKNLFISLNRYVFFLNNYQNIDKVNFNSIVETYNSKVTQLSTQPTVDQLLSSYKELINIYKQLVNEINKIEKTTQPIVLTDTEYDKIMEMWSLQPVYKKFNTPGRREDTINGYNKYLSNIKYDKKYDPFVLIYTDKLNRLPIDLKKYVNDFLLTPLFQRNESSNPFALLNDSATVYGKKKYVVWNKLISELLVKFEVPPTMSGGASALPPPASIDARMPATFSAIKKTIMDTLSTKSPIKSVVEKSVLSTVESPILPPTESTSASPIVPPIAPPIAPLLEYDAARPDTTVTTPMISSKIASTTAAQSMTTNITSPLFDPLIKKPINNIQSLAAFQNIQLNAAHVINEYMSYLNDDDMQKSSIYSFRTRDGGGIGRTLSIKKTKSKKNQTLRKKQTMASLTKHTMALRQKQSLLKTHLDEGDVLKIKMHEMFINHTYSLLNSILLKDYSQDSSYVLHPLLPLFMLTEALSINSAILMDDPKLAADDYADYYDYYYFLNELYIYIKEELAQIHYHAFGLCLRYFLFTNLYLLHPAFVSQYINYRSFFTFTTTLTTYISGTIFDNSSFDIDFSNPLIIEASDIFLAKLQIYSDQHMRYHINLNHKLNRLKRNIQKEINI